MWLEARALGGRPLIRFACPDPGDWNVASKMCMLAQAFYEEGRWQPGQPFIIADLFGIEYQMQEADIAAAALG